MNPLQALPASASATARRTRVRWLVLAVLFAVTTINYADRAAIAIAPEPRPRAAPEPRADGLHLFRVRLVVRDRAMPGGWLLDRYGSRIVYAFSIFFWSLFTLLQGGIGFGGAAAFALLFGLRFLVGAAEARRSRPTAGSCPRGSRPPNAAPRRRSSTPRSTRRPSCSRR